jgi:hypothetical protein
MLATMQRMLHKLTRSRRASAQDEEIAKLADVRRRHASARAMQQLVDSASASRSPSTAQFPHPQWEAPLLLSTNVVDACRPQLLAAKEMLAEHPGP